MWIIPGTENATVLPEPVCAIPMTSRPDAKICMSLPSQLAAGSAASILEQAGPNCQFHAVGIRPGQNLRLGTRLQQLSADPIRTGARSPVQQESGPE